MPFSSCTLLQLETYNGSAIVAMAGDKCVAIGSDLRFGVQMQTMATDYHKLSQIHDRLFIGLSGLGTDQVLPALSSPWYIQRAEGNEFRPLHPPFYVLSLHTEVNLAVNVECSMFAW